MKSQLYVPESTKRYFQSQMSSFIEIYFQKLLPVFRDIEKEAEECESGVYNNYMNRPSDGSSLDPGAIAEGARDVAVEHYSFLKLGRYHLTATWHAMLYELWEQQIRSFLFEEISKDKTIGGFKNFCETFSKIKAKLELHGVDTTAGFCWSKIDELNLLCNIIKHSHGSSLDRLRRKNPALLKKGNFTKVDLIELYRTSLLEEVLNIDETTLKDYKEALLSFWENIPERNYSSE